MACPACKKPLWVRFGLTAAEEVHQRQGHLEPGLPEAGCGGGGGAAGTAEQVPGRSCHFVGGLLWAVGALHRLWRAGHLGGGHREPALLPGMDYLVLGMRWARANSACFRMWGGPELTMCRVRCDLRSFCTFTTSLWTLQRVVYCKRAVHVLMHGRAYRLSVVGGDWCVGGLVWWQA